MGAINPLIITKPCAVAPGGTIPLRRVVVFDPTTKGLVKLPASTPEKTICGVSMESSTSDGFVAVAVAGIVQVESDGSAVINPGDSVTLVGTTGRVKAQALAAGSANVYGILGTCQNRGQVAATAGAIVDVLINIDLAVAA